MVKLQVLDEIKNMVSNNNIDPDDALRLILIVQAETFEILAAGQKQWETLEKRVEKIENDWSRWPSVTWLWSNRRRELVTVAVILALLYTLLFSPWLISDIRHAVLDYLNLPTDFGIGSQ